jgi:hypothetical protein
MVSNSQTTVISVRKHLYLFICGILLFFGTDLKAQSWSGTISVCRSATTANFTFKDSVCEGSPVTFTADISSAINSYLWNFGDGSSSTGDTTYRTYSVTRHFRSPLIRFWTYPVTLTIRDIYGCTDSITKKVRVFRNTLNITSIGPYETVCVGSSIQINVHGGSMAIGGWSPLNYLWSNGATTSTDTVTQTGNYSVTITDAVGCQKVLGPMKYIQKNN